MELLGWIGAVAMGLTLGLIGGGGSILAVPILVYLLRIPGTVATYESLFIVGMCAAVGSLSYARKGRVNFRTGLLFFAPSVAGVLLSRRWILPAIPEHWPKDLIILAAFGVVMISAAFSMIRESASRSRKVGPVPLARTSLTGFGVGAVTGFVGAGGGFLIVPVLVNGLSLPMETAVGTSLFVIALNSLAGFAADTLSGMHASWERILGLSGVALIGVGLGTYLNRFIPSQKLKPLFGWFVLTVGILMLLNQGRILMRG